MNTTNANNAKTNLNPGTMVVCRFDGQPGRVVRVCTYRRNGQDAWSYLIDTTDGREIWDASAVVVVADPQA